MPPFTYWSIFPLCVRIHTKVILSTYSKRYTQLWKLCIVLICRDSEFLTWLDYCAVCSNYKSVVCAQFFEERSTALAIIPFRNAPQVFTFRHPMGYRCFCNCGCWHRSKSGCWLRCQSSSNGCRYSCLRIWYRGCWLRCQSSGNNLRHGRLHIWHRGCWLRCQSSGNNLRHGRLHIWCGVWRLLNRRIVISEDLTSKTNNA